MPRLVAGVLMVLAAVVVLCALGGYAVTIHEAARVEAEHRAALQGALGELHPSFGGADAVEDMQLRLIERGSGLKDLRFDTDPVGNPGRESQSVLGRDGRIIGWLSWAPEPGSAATMTWLWPLTGVVGVMLLFAAFAARRILSRTTQALSRSGEEIRRLTSEDPLTGLANHRLMLERLDDALKQRQRDSVALLRIDPDCFRDINDTLGRAGGDSMLAAITERLKSALPADAQLGRFEDDELAVIAASGDADAATALADALRAALARPFYMEQSWQISAGIGIALAPQDGETAEEISRRAGHALHAAKRDGRAKVRRFERKIEEEYSERRVLRRDLEAAIAAQAIDIAYQPIVAAVGGGIVGVEALARWNHPRRGAVAPSVFIALAEASGLMPQLGEIVLRRALGDGARWPSLSVSVNLSPLQIRDGNLVGLVGAVMSETGISSSRVVLEVTESVLIDDTQSTLERLEALRALGVSIALDDFGTGYSSLSYLQKFPFSLLKIDRAFVASLGATANAGAIVQSIVALGHGLGMKVVAEGVETDEQRVLLRLAGCDEMQGFLFARPRPADAIDKALERSGPMRAARRPAAGAAR